MERSLPREAYLDEAFFERERRHIFWDQWFLVEREERLAEPGAFCVVDVAGESVVVVRDAAGDLHAHLNLCRHRGSRLLCGAGVLHGAIKCPYHAWAYALDGTLVASPFVERSELPEDVLHLHRAGVATWGGFVFVHLDPQAASEGLTLEAQLGEAPARVARYPLAELHAARTIVYEVAANWKVILENYNECYHCAGVHPELCKIVPAFKHRGGAELDWERGIPHRDGAFTFTATGTTVRKPFPGLDRHERERHKGELLYPNVMLSLAAEHVAAFTLFPQGPAATRIVCDFLFHAEEIARPDFDPSDAVDFWDLVNRQDWRICESVQDGMRSRAFRYGYYAPMEDWSLDIRRYVGERLGDA